MIETITELEALRARVREWRQQGLRVGFVPTMGNLHAGHYSLVMLARQYADRVVSSVFVNPTQFGPNEDFTRYPRTPEADMSGLEGAGCDVLWLPTVESMYPFGVGLAANVHVPGVAFVDDRGAELPRAFEGERRHFGLEPPRPCRFEIELTGQEVRSSATSRRLHVSKWNSMGISSTAQPPSSPSVAGARS